MNFIFTDDQTFKPMPQEEIVVILKKKNEKIILLHFPSERFNDFKQKEITFIEKIKGRHEKGYIVSSDDSYNIYEEFYSIFY